MAFDRVLLSREPVVDVLRLAVLDVEAPAAELAGLREDHALGAALGNVEVGVMV